MSVNPALLQKRIDESVQKLPALPDVVTRLLSVVNSPYSNADDAAALIEKDPALTGAVLRMANSAFYGMPRSVSNVSAAIVILGFNAVRSIVITTAVFKAVPGLSNFDMTAFWKHSLAVSAGAKLIAQKSTCLDAPDPETCFCAGILHDTGKIVLQSAFPEEYVQVLGLCAQKEMPLHRAELEVLGINHTRVGRLIADKWGLPSELEQSIVFHHEPLAAEHMVEYALAISFGDAFAHRAGITTIEHETAPYLPHASLAQLGITDAVFEQTYDRFLIEVDKTVEFLSALGGRS